MARKPLKWDAKDKIPAGWKAVTFVKRHPKFAYAEGDEGIVKAGLLAELTKGGYVTEGHSKTKKES